MNILVTGAGLIGCHSAGRLLEEGQQVVLYDVLPDQPYIQAVVGKQRGVTVETGDLRDLSALIAVMEKYRIDTVVHTAGLIGKKVAERAYTGITVNVLGTMHVAEAVRLMKVKRLVFVSTFGVYKRDPSAGRPITEDSFLGGSGLYGATKVANENLLGALSDLYGFELIVLRPAGVFGQGHYRGGSAVGVVMNDLMLSAARGETVRVRESLLGTNEYVYVKDVAQAVAKACSVPNVKSRAFNVGTGIIAAAEDMVQSLREAVPGVRVELVSARPDEQVKRQVQPLDLSRSSAELGYTPEYGLVKAMADYMRVISAA